MPELPEVETTKASLEPLLHQTVAKVSIRYPTLRYAIPKDLDSLIGFRLVAVPSPCQISIAGFLSSSG